MPHVYGPHDGSHLRGRDREGGQVGRDEVPHAGGAAVLCRERGFFGGMEPGEKVRKLPDFFMDFWMVFLEA